MAYASVTAVRVNHTVNASGGLATITGADFNLLQVFCVWTLYLDRYTGLNDSAAGRP